MDLDQLFVRNLKKWRKNRGFSQKILAERCNAAHSYIRQLESGSGKPSFAFIGKLCEALEIEAYQLFYDETVQQGRKPSQAAYLKTIKTDFLEKVAIELDSAINKLQNRDIYL
ncbi:MAG: helix-turn-helix domain-containing protein [Treponema sp.]|nr:helix-turn-helix domain-containing protein [Treponema sp.]